MNNHHAPAQRHQGSAVGSSSVHNGTKSLPVSRSSSNGSMTMPVTVGSYADRSPMSCGSSTPVRRKKRKAIKHIGKYALGEIIGEGSFGKVREGVDTTSFRRVAVKTIHRKRLRKIKNGMSSLRRELECLRQLNSRASPHVIELVDYIDNPEKFEKIYIVFEMVTNGSLEQLLDEQYQKGVPESLAQWFFSQLMDGLQSCHSRGIVHRDVKPANLLIGQDLFLKIVDFGVAERIDHFDSEESCRQWTGTPAYQSPELLSGADEYNGMKSDVWAAGVTLFQMLCGRVPFYGTSYQQLIENITKGKYEIPEHVQLSADVMQVIDACLQVDAQKRPDVDTIRSLPWVSQPIEKAAILSLIKQRPPPLHKPLLERLMDEEESDDDESFENSNFRSGTNTAESTEQMSTKSTTASGRRKKRKGPAGQGDDAFGKRDIDQAVSLPGEDDNMYDDEDEERRAAHSLASKKDKCTVQ